jgi:hypothetical protein
MNHFMLFKSSRIAEGWYIPPPQLPTPTPQIMIKRLEQGV